MITKINTIILIVLAIFFPQMPLVHGADSVSISHCSDGKMHHESQESSDHNMSLCVDIIRNIDKGITDDPFIFPDFVPPVFFSF